MRQTLGFVIFILGLLLFSSLAFAGQYSADFSQYLAEHQDGGQYVSAIIAMADQVDLRILQDQLYAIKADRQAWHEAVVRALQEKATMTQVNLIARLDELVASGQVERYQAFWIGNVIAVSASPKALDEIVMRTDVLQVSPDYEIEGIRPVEENGGEPIISSHEIGLTRIKADSCWGIGITGQGRLVSNIDTGVLGTHEALSARWAGNDPRYAGHPEWAWLDPYTTNWPTPNDVNGHGTHTMGTICGRSESGDTIGVAMDAQWIAAAAIDRGGGIPRTVSDAIASFQWIADPDENPGTVWDVPDVCSNSWGVTTSHGYPPCDQTFWSVIDGCEAAGVVVVFAAGNEGASGPSTIRRPADRATTLYSTFSVGAVDGATANMPIAGFSSRGPSNCTPDGSATFKPEVSAPGVNVRSSYDDGGYTTLSGTSMACPHVAGVVALIRQANPNLTSEQVKQIMYETAVESPADNIPGEDNTYGMGVVNAYQAVLLAMSYLDGWGTMGGVITDQATGNPIVGAHISVLDRPWAVDSRLNGQYYIFMPSDTAWIVKIEKSPTHLPIYDTVTVVENDTIFRDYALEGKVTATLMASFANPAHVSYRPFYIKGSWNTDGFWDGAWSAPLIEIRDNGLSPDQAANDGIFTGSVMLARDLIHTYGWAIYSENYGGEAARLQNGADFQILNLTPPSVPTLAVNPSGSENNWIITAVGNHGLNLDLSHPVNNSPTKWGAATPLDSGLTYAFRFNVMHSVVASYGAGGIGGVDILFNCAFSGSYDFIFNDANDSYVVQLAGTEGPPTNLVVSSGLDSHIPVAWQTPVGPIQSDVEVLAGYNLYRSTAPGAYNGGDANRVNSSMIVVNNYDDWGGRLDSIVNGQIYYYQAAALYDIGGGQIVEVGPSNEANGTAVNLPPYRPYGLQATENSRTIYATWSFGDSARDLAHFNVYKRLMPQGTTILVGSPTTPDYSFAIPDGEDGVYKITVTAVDDGTPPLESAPSEEVYVAVGHLPPGALTAISGHEFEVPLSWILPGSWRVANVSRAPVEPIVDNPDMPEEMLKGAIEPEYPPMLLGRGGPDSAGYEWIDSDEPDGPSFDWIDITSDGVEITPWPHGTVDDGYTDLIPMGMDFMFYGISYTDIVVGTNGWVSFQAQTSSHIGNEAIPNNTTPNAIVAVEWDDLDGGSVGHCYYKYDALNDQFIVSWVGWPYYPDPTAPHDIQVILKSGGTIIAQYRNGTSWQSDVTVGIENEAGTVGLQVTYNQSYLHNDMAIKYSAGPEGVQPVHYKLYRGISPNVPINPANLINGSISGELTSYLDQDNLLNGVTYYYKLTAVWPDSIESPPTNEASGTPANFAPQAPINLTGNVNNRTIGVSWSHNDAMGDRDHFNVYKKLMPSGPTVLAGTATDTSFSFDIPNGEDGLYMIRVTAVDDGTPPLESAMSEGINLAVGHLPPTGLYAIGGRDSYVPLIWSPPGSWIAGSGDRPVEPPMLLGRGGPDAFGYEWIDSDEPDGPIFNWVDITGDGVEVSPWPHGSVDDGYTDLVPMDMDFEFYGITYNSVSISTNGWISFLPVSSSYLANAAIPGTALPNAFIAVEWDNLDGGTVGHCYYKYDAAQNRFIISWINWPYYPDPTEPRDFQVILHGYSGKIITQYRNGNLWQSDVTVGIENESGTDGLQVTYNQNYLHNDLAIKFSNHPDGIAPVHYKLYRGTSPNVPLDPAHLHNGNIAGSLVNYTDSTNVQNNVTYYYKLTAVWTDSVESPPTNEAVATPVTGARMTADPLSFDVNGVSGEIVTRNLNISNPGGLTLDFAIMAQTTLLLSGGPANSDAMPVSSTRSGNIGDEECKDNPANEPEGPPMLLGRGGPDEFGYVWIDSDEPDGPTYDWIDITADGVEISPWPHGSVDDGYTDPIPMGMSFPFYGVTYSDIVISTNGWISFMPVTSSYLTNAAIPNSANPNAIVAVEWDDLDGGTVGHCYYKYDVAQNRFIVSWVGWPYYPDPLDPHDIQVVLNGDGSIVTQYGINGNVWQTDVTVGIENEDGSIGLQVAYNQAYLHNEMAIRYSTGWLSANPSSGSIVAGGNLNVTVIFDATLLEAGDYVGSLLLTGSDVNREVNPITIPVIFHVSPNVGVNDGAADLPSKFALAQNYPNPFNPTTEIKFDLPVQAFVNLQVFNILGQRVRTLVNSEMEAGYKSIVWDSTDDSGKQIASGAYFYVLKAGGQTFTRKMTMMK